MKIKCLQFICLLLFITTVTAQDNSLYKKEWYIAGTDTLPYRILLPLNYDANQEYPLIFLLHGAGERGSDNQSQLVHGGALFLKDSIRQAFPAIVVFPQCPLTSFWSNVEFKMDSVSREFIFSANKPPTIAMDLLQQLLQKTLKDYKVKKKQVYVGGLSMGGMGTFEIVRRNPKLFAAAFPICGGGDPSTAEDMKKVKWWVFHGAIDAVVPPKYSQIMVDALKAVNADVQFSLYPNVNHNSWDNAFAEPGLLPWLFAQHK